MRDCGPKAGDVRKTSGDELDLSSRDDTLDQFLDCLFLIHGLSAKLGVEVPLLSWNTGCEIIPQ